MKLDPERLNAQRLQLLQQAQRTWGVLPGHMLALSAYGREFLLFEEARNCQDMVLEQMVRGALDGMFCARCGMSARLLHGLTQLYSQVLCAPRPRIVMQWEGGEISCA